jgi:hypothetical protein
VIKEELIIDFAKMNAFLYPVEFLALQSDLGLLFIEKEFCREP